MAKLFDFLSYFEDKLATKAFVGIYYNGCLYSMIDFNTLQQQRNELEEKEITKFTPLGKAESGSACVQSA